MLMCCDVSWPHVNSYDHCLLYNVGCNPNNIPIVDHASYIKKQDRTVEYTCDDAYTVAGTSDSSAIIRCNNGAWSDPPSCIMDTPASCGSPPSTIANGILDLGLSDSSTSFGSQKSYKCDMGYEFSDEDVVYEITCQENGEWTAMEDCQGQLRTCRPSSLDILQKQLGSITFDHPLRWSEYSTLDYLTMIFMQCHIFPLTLAVDCGPLPNPPHGSVSHPLTTYQSTATYTCSNSNLVGDTTRTCQYDGTWSGSQPTCDNCK